MIENIQQTALLVALALVWIPPGTRGLDVPHWVKVVVLSGLLLSGLAFSVATIVRIWV